MALALFPSCTGLNLLNYSTRGDTVNGLHDHIGGEEEDEATREADKSLSDWSDQ